MNLKVGSKEQDWIKAISIFENRIRGRYLNTIEELIFYKQNLYVDGFIVMSINCLLIETLLQFKNGWNETPTGKNKAEYEKFLIEDLKSGFEKKINRTTLANKFYTDIRCGILHSAQTKNKSKLTVDGKVVIKINEEGGITVDVNKMSMIIIHYFDEYIKKLKNPENVRERLHFCDKMDYICQK